MNKKSAVYVLKSGIQKAVRRGNDKGAVQLTAAALKIDPYDTIRRLPIIILEDSVPDKDFIFIVERVKQGKKWEVTEADKQVIYNTGANAAQSKIRDTLYQGDTVEPDSDLGALAGQERALCQAMRDRAQWRGTDFDVGLCNFRANEYADKFKLGYKVPDVQKQVYIPTPLSVKDFNLEAIDQHCSGIVYYLIGTKLIKKLGAQDKEKTFKLVKTLLWAERAGVNNKQVGEIGKRVNWMEEEGNKSLTLPNAALLNILPELHKLCDAYATRTLSEVVKFVNEYRPEVIITKVAKVSPQLELEL